MADETAGYDESVDPIGDTPTAVAPSREQKLEAVVRKLGREWKDKVGEWVVRQPEVRRALEAK